MARTDYKALRSKGFQRQVQRDCFTLCLDGTGGVLLADELNKIAQIASSYGNGCVSLTSRQTVEIPNIRLKDIDAVSMAVQEAGLTPCGDGPGIRMIMACPGNILCPNGKIDALDIAESLDERYHERSLPGKLNIAVSGCFNNCMKAEANDIGIKGAVSKKWKAIDCLQCGLCSKVCNEKAIAQAGKRIIVDEALCTGCGRCVQICPTHTWSVQEAYQVYFFGIFGHRPALGERLLALITSKEELLHVMDAAVLFFEENGKSGERLRDTVARTGREAFLDAVGKARDGHTQPSKSACP